MKLHNITILFYLTFILYLQSIYAQSTSKEFQLLMDDGVHIDATRFTPAGSPPQGGFPAVIFVHGLGGNKTKMERTAREFADSGYVTLTYSVRGQGNSEGLSTVFSYREQQDLENIINWLAQRPIVNDTLIGVSGASQGGFHSWFAGVNRMNVKAVAPENSIPQRVDAAVRYECYQEAVKAELNSSPNLRLDTLFYPLKKWLLADNYDSVRAVINHGRHFDSTDVASSSARYLMMGAWHDHVFPHNRVPGAYSAAPGGSFLYLGTGGHGSEFSRKEAEFREQLKRNFFAETLKGEDRGLSAFCPITVSLGPDWKHYQFNSWPPSDQQTQTFYLHCNGTLSIEAPVASSCSHSIRHSLTDKTYTWERAVNKSFKGLSSAFLLERGSWRTEPLSDTLKILGIPTANVYARGPSPRFQINLQLYDEPSMGEPTYLSQISLGKRENPDSNVWHTMQGEFVIIGWEIQPGHRLRVDWASYNKTLTDTSVWTIPFWKADGRLTLGLDSAHPTCIRIPVLKTESTGIPDNKKSSLNISINDFQLAQNYPNPFNPITNISFYIPSHSPATLNIYNLLGRKILTLVDDELEPGIYNKTLNAEKLSDGVYFYRLQVGEKVLTRKMILLR